MLVDIREEGRGRDARQLQVRRIPTRSPSAGPARRGRLCRGSSAIT